MNEAQVWAVIAIWGVAVLLVVAERLLARLVKLWVAEAVLRTLRPLFKALAADSGTSLDHTPHSRGHVEAPRTSWARRHRHGCGIQA